MSAAGVAKDMSYCCSYNDIAYGYSFRCSYFSLKITGKAF